MTQKQKGVFQITMIYLIIALSGWLSWKLIPIENEVVLFLAADVVMTIICFAFSMIYKNSSVYDAYWSFLPFYFVVMWVILHGGDLTSYHQITYLLITVWSWRLTLNWVRSWSGMHHEDWRYVDLKNKTGIFYPLVSFSGIHLFPTLLVFGGMWPLFYLFQNNELTEWIFMLGALITSCGILFEFFADNALAKFKRRPNPLLNEVLDKGIWNRCRHPNYLGEMLFWIGLGLIGISFHAPWYTLSGALAMLLLFNFISIQLKEERMEKKGYAWESYKQRVPRLIPRIF